MPGPTEGRKHHGLVLTAFWELPMLPELHMGIFSSEGVKFWPECWQQDFYNVVTPFRKYRSGSGHFILSFSSIKKAKKGKQADRSRSAAVLDWP